MASIGFLIEGALINALAFTGSNYLFSSLSKESIEKERKRHDKAIEVMQQAQLRLLLTQRFLTFRCVPGVKIKNTDIVLPVKEGPRLP